MKTTNSKLRKVLAVVLIVLLFAMGVVGGYYGLCSLERACKQIAERDVSTQNSYDEAVKLMECGDYATALRIFLDLGDWQNSKALLGECLDRLETIQNAYYAYEPHQADPTH